MRRDIVYALGLALALVGAGAWAVDQQPADNGAGAGTALQNPAPANPNPAAPPDQTAPNAAQPNAAQPNPAPENQPPPNPAPPNPAPPNPAPPNAVQPAPEQPNPGQTAQPQSSVPGQPGTTSTPVYSSPLQEFASRNVDEVGELSQELTQFKAAKRPEAVMALYHMIRDHRLLADAAQNILARRGDDATPTITTMPVPNTPEDMIHQDIQGHEALASNLQQLIANTSLPEEKRLYQRGLDVTNQHLNWLHSLDQGQQVALGFFGPTTSLGDLIGTTTVASAPGYPQPVVTRTAGLQQQYAGSSSAGSARRTAMRRSIRHRRYRSRRYSRYHRYSRTNSYR